MHFLSEGDIKLEINEALKNKGWELSGKKKNVFTEKTCSVGRADYILKPLNRENPLVIIEAKRKGRDLNQALKQAQGYAEQFKCPIAYASDGSTIKTIHLKNLKPLIFNGEEIDEFVSETIALQYLHSNEYSTLGQKVIKSRQELINIFAYANKELRKEGLQAGIERFSEFCNILFLKIFSEEEESREEQGQTLRIPKEFNWNYFKNKDGNELLSYVNDTVLKHFRMEYGTDIFAPLQLKNPLALKRIIDSLDPLSLVDTNSDIKGDAFEYFLKAYLAGQNKDLGEYFTPRHIVKTLVKLVNPKYGETLYDPFCGTGGILIEAFRHIYSKMPRKKDTLECLKKETIYGAEITKNARITKMNMILTGDGHNNIIKQDSLKNPDFIIKQTRIKEGREIKIDAIKKFDCVITNMPFSLGNLDEYSDLYQLGSANANSLCIEHCFKAIDSNSANPRIGVIVPEGILFDKKFKKLREYIYKNSYVRNIVSLPSGAFKPYTDVKTSILYLTEVNQKKNTQVSLWHYTVKNDGYTLNNKRRKKEGENDLNLFLSFNDAEHESSLLHIGFSKLNLEEVKNNDYISIPNPYRKFEFNGKFENIVLGQLIEECKLRNDQNANIWSVTNDKGFVVAKDRFDEKVASENTTKYKLVLPEAFAYNPSRINVGSIAFNSSRDTGCVSPMYVVFKISSENLLKAEYLYRILQSEPFKKQVNSFAFGSVRQTVNFTDFCKITVPLPKIYEQQMIVRELESYEKVTHGAQDIIASWKPFFELKESWKILKLKDVCHINPPKEKTQAATCSFLPMDDMQANKIYTSPRKNRKTTEVERGYTFFKENDLLIAKITPCFENNKISIVKNLTNNIGFGSTEFIVVRALEGISIEWVFTCLQRLNFIDDGKSVMSGSAGQQRITSDFVKNYSIPLPPKEIQEKILNKLANERNTIDAVQSTASLFSDKITNKLNSVWQSAF